MVTPPMRIDEVAARLRALRAETGDPSYAEIARRITALRSADDRVVTVSRATVYDCFRDGRKRFDTRLVIAIVRVLSHEEGTARAWASALAVLGRRSAEAAVVTVSDALPSAASPFVGRTRELTLLAKRGPHWISAMAGAGKTALAVQAARAAIESGAAQGALVADLRGHSPAGPPAQPHAVVRALLRQLGDRSGTLAEPAARRLLRERLRESGRVLLLDDAASPEQVLGILHSPAELPVLVTSRVVAGDARFRHLPLALFAPYESLALLDALAGRATIERDPASAEALLELTDHQPLAVSLTAARVAAQPEWSLAEHLEAARARRASLRLDPPIARSLELTYRQLGETAQHLLRALAEHPVALLDDESLVAVAGAAPEEVAGARAELERHSLLERTPDGGARMHELVRVHAVDRGLEVDPPSRRRAAVQRLQQSVVDRAWSAQQARGRARLETGRAPRTRVTVRPWSPAEADAFLRDRADLLLHVALHAETTAAPAVVNLIAETFDDALHRAGRADDAAQLHRAALAAARALGDAAAELRAIVDLGTALVLMGRATEAEAVLAAADRSAAGWAEEAPLACNALGASLLAQGRNDEARAALEEGLAAALDRGDLWREGRLWNSTGLLELRTGDLAAARAAIERSIAISDRCGDLDGAARGLVNLSKLLLDLGEDAAAAAHARRGLAAMESLGNVPGVVVALSNLAAAAHATGDLQEAAGLAERGLAVAREAGMLQQELELLRTLGDVRLTAGSVAAARETLETARRLATELGDAVGAAGSLEDLGDCALAEGDVGEARRLWSLAAAGYDRASVLGAEAVRAKLAQHPLAGADEPTDLTTAAG